MTRQSVPVFEVRLFGEVSVVVGDRQVAFPSVKSLELLCYLLIHSDRPHTRESLADVMWPAGQSAVSKSYLRQALWRLGRSLGDADIGDLLTIGPDWVRVDSDAAWRLDVKVFEAAYLRARDTPARELTDHQITDVRAALDLYRGELMATWYHDWCTQERDRLQLIFLSLLELLMGWCEVRGRFLEGVDHAQRVLRHDPARESTHRQLMRLHHRAGDRTSALRQFRTCAAALDEEFGIAPSAATVRLHDRIRADLTIDPPHPQTAVDVGGDGGVHARLDQIQAGVAALHEALRFHVGQHHDSPAGSPLRPVKGAS